MSKFLILKAGSTHPELKKIAGDTHEWIINAIDQPSLHFETISLHEMPVEVDFTAYQGVFITGSHSNVTEKQAWMQHAHGILKKAIGLNKPILGICFGHQLLADALGGVVNYHPVHGESGIVDLDLHPIAQTNPLTANLPPHFVVFAAHEQSVITLPNGAVCLGGNAHEPHHIVMFAKGVWGVQFHPEFTKTISNHYFDLDNLNGNRGSETDYQTAKTLGKQLLDNFLTYCRG